MLVTKQWVRRVRHLGMFLLPPVWMGFAAALWQRRRETWRYMLRPWLFYQGLACQSLVHTRGFQYSLVGLGCAALLGGGVYGTVTYVVPTIAQWMASASDMPAPAAPLRTDCLIQEIRVTSIDSALDGPAPDLTGMWRVLGLMLALVGCAGMVMGHGSLALSAMAGGILLTFLLPLLHSPLGGC
jgi:hypothetical protein